MGPASLTFIGSFRCLFVCVVFRPSDATLGTDDCESGLDHLDALLRVFRV